MWKKDETETTPPRQPQPQAQPPRTREAPPAPAAATPTSKQATIGPSITIKGEVTGDEDLLIQGTVDGSVDLGQHAVEVGREGRVKANITGRIVTVEGEVEGDLEAAEQIVLRPSAHVQGDISAPRVVLEDGARFRGMVEMGEAVKERAKASRGAEKKSGTSGGSSATASNGKASDEKDEKDSKDAEASSASGASGPSGKKKEEPQKVGGAAS